MKVAFLLLKSASMALISVYSFLIVYVLVRTVPVDTYPWVVFFSALGSYVIAVDLGYAGFLYASTRKKYVEGAMQGQGATVIEAANIYLIASLASVPPVAAAIYWLLDASLEIKLAMAVYFLTIVLSLPWMLLRRAGAAVDLFVSLEVLELARRLVFCLLAAAMLAGLSFLAFALLCLVAWAAAYAVAALLLARRGLVAAFVRPRRLIQHVRDHRRSIFASGWFTVLEFMIYNFPYMIMPFLYTDATRIIAFDVFYKIVRFGGVAYGVATETVLPYQTRAFHAGDFGKVRAYMGIALALGAIPALAASAGLLIGGEAFFRLLLDNAALVSPATRHAMVAMLLLILLQATAGQVLVGVGRYGSVSKAALVTALLMALLIVAAFALDLTFDAFLAVYVAIYGLHALMFQWLFHRLGAEMRPPV